MQRNAVCEGTVIHRRSLPLTHEFRYPMWMLWVDVDRLDALRSPLFSRRWRLAPLSLLDGDFPRDPISLREGCGSGIRGAVNARLHREGLGAADQVCLLTQPRSWGWLFNPVSFYFCFRQGALVAVLSEITNTPWDEVYTYVLPVSAREGSGCNLAFPKRFHVSPFMPMDMDYRWRVEVEDDAVQIAVGLSRGGEEQFFAGLYLERRPLTAAALNRGALRFPLQNLRTLARIYYQAFRLWRRRAPFHPHPRTLAEAESHERGG